MTWYLNDKEFTEADAEQLINDGYVGFVYLITNLEDGKKYVGKKLIKSVRKLPPLKGKKRRRTKVSQSDWQEYYGSSEAVKELVESKGPDNFKREILHLCRGKGELSYMELFEQVQRRVLFNDEYYNEFIGCKLHSKHVSNLKDTFST